MLQLTEVRIKEEESSLDDALNYEPSLPESNVSSSLDDASNFEPSLPDSNVESSKSSSSIDVTQIKTWVSREKMVTHRTKSKRKLEENFLKKKKQRQSTSNKTQDEKNAQPLGKKRVYLRRSLPRLSKSFPLGTFGHQLVVSGSLHQCHICGSGFEKYSELLLHRKSCHNISSQSHISRLARNLCRRSVFTKLNSPPVAASHVMKWLCRFCHWQFPRSSECRAHILKFHPPKFKKLSLQQTKLHRRCSTSVGVFKCYLCRRPFVHQSSLQTHCAKNHRQIKAVDRKQMHHERKKDKSHWRCQQNDCSAVCKSVEQVKRHMAAEHPAVLFSCPNCKFTSQVERIFLRYLI